MCGVATSQKNAAILSDRRGKGNMPKSEAVLGDPLGLCGAKVDLDFLDLLSVSPKELSISKFFAIQLLRFVPNESFVPFFKYLLDHERTNVSTVRPTS